MKKYLPLLCILSLLFTHCKRNVIPMYTDYSPPATKPRVITEVERAAIAGEVFTFDELTGAVTGLQAAHENDETLVIPLQIKGVSVKSIAPRAFAAKDLQVNYKPLYDLNVYGAFSVVDNLTPLPFVYTSRALKSMEVKAPIERIGKEAFAGCSQMKAITLADKGLIAIDSAAFFHCDALEAIQLPDGLQSIAANAFEYNFSLRSIRIPNSVHTLGMATFSFCTALQKVELSQSLTTISYNLFRFCEQLNHVVIPNSVTTIAQEAFIRCKALDDITLSNRLERIEDFAFVDCYAIREFTFPASLKELGRSILIACSRISKITFLSLVPPKPISGKEFVITNKWSLYYYAPKEGLKLYQKDEYLSHLWYNDGLNKLRAL